MTTKSQAKRIKAQSGRDVAIIQPWGTNDLMATAAVRYCLGRRTYIVRECADWIIRHWENFESRTRTQIQRDVEEAIANDRIDRRNNVQPPHLGDDCDRADWERVRKLWMQLGNA